MQPGRARRKASGTHLVASWKVDARIEIIWSTPMEPLHDEEQSSPNPVLSDGEDSVTRARRIEATGHMLLQQRRYEALISEDRQNGALTDHGTSCATISFVIAREPHFWHLVRSTAWAFGMKMAGPHPVQHIIDLPTFCKAAPANSNSSVLP